MNTTPKKPEHWWEVTWYDWTVNTFVILSFLSVAALTIVAFLNVYGISANSFTVLDYIIWTTILTGLHFIGMVVTTGFIITAKPTEPFTAKNKTIHAQRFFYRGFQSADI